MEGLGHESEELIRCLLEKLRGWWSGMVEVEITDVRLRHYSGEGLDRDNDCLVNCVCSFA